MNRTTAIIVIVIVGLAAFYGGMKYGQSSAAAPADATQQLRGQGGNGGQGGRRLGGQNGGFVNGEVIAKDAQSLTVKMRDGSTKLVFFSSSTSLGKATQGTLTDLAVGQQVMVSGTAASDGSVSAQSIQIRPAEPAPAQPGQ